MGLSQGEHTAATSFCSSVNVELLDTGAKVPVCAAACVAKATQRAARTIAVCPSGPGIVSTPAGRDTELARRNYYEELSSNGSLLGRLTRLSIHTVAKILLTTDTQSHTTLSRVHRQRMHAELPHGVEDDVASLGASGSDQLNAGTPAIGFDHRCSAPLSTSSEAGGGGGSCRTHMSLHGREWETLGVAVRGSGARGGGRCRVRPDFAEWLLKILLGITLSLAAPCAAGGVVGHTGWTTSAQGGDCDAACVAYTASLGGLGLACNAAGLSRMAAITSNAAVYTVDVAIGSEQNAGAPPTTSAFCGAGVSLGAIEAATGSGSGAIWTPYVECASAGADYRWPTGGGQTCDSVGLGNEARVCCCLATGDTNPVQTCALGSADCVASAMFWDTITMRCIPWSVMANAYNDNDGLWQNVGSITIMFSSAVDADYAPLPWFKLLLPTSGTDCGTVAGVADSPAGMHARMSPVSASTASGSATVNSVYTDIKICWSNTEGGTYADPTDGPRRLSTFASDVYIYNAEHSSCVTVASLGVLACCQTETKILIAPEITTIKANAFELCNLVTTVDFQYATNLASIEDEAFWNMAALATLAQFGSSTSVTSIGAMAFNLCPSLAALTVPSNVVTIGRLSFYGTALEQSSDVSFNGVDCCAATLAALGDAFIFGCPTLCPYAAWDFAGAVADTIPDAALSGVNAVLNGGTARTATGAVFDGTDDYAELRFADGGIAPRFVGKSMTLEIIATFASFPSGVGLLEFGTGPQASPLLPNSLSCGIDGVTGCLVWTVHQEGGGSMVVTTDVADALVAGVRYHIVLTVTAWEIAIFVNGVEKKRSATSLTAQEQPAVNPVLGAFIGKAYAAGLPFFDGEVASFKIHYGEMMQAEVASACRTAVGVACALHAWDYTMPTTGSGYSPDSVGGTGNALITGGTTRTSTGTLFVASALTFSTLQMGAVTLGGSITVETVVKYTTFTTYAPLLNCGNGQDSDNIVLSNVGSTGRLSWRILQGASFLPGYTQSVAVQCACLSTPIAPY